MAGGLLDPGGPLLPLSLADECVAMAADTTLGVVLTRSQAIDLGLVDRLCLEINQAGRGVIGVSSILAPIRCCCSARATRSTGSSRGPRSVLRARRTSRTDQKWPALHTPIIGSGRSSNRAAERMHTLPMSRAAKPRIFSLVTGDYAYTATNARELLNRWIDHPQRLWDAVYETVSSGATTVIHLGLDPILTPPRSAGSARTSPAKCRTAVAAGSRGGAAAVAARLLPQRAAMLRAGASST